MKTEQTDAGILETWTPDEVEKAMGNRDIVVIDVRTPQEYMLEHIEGALLMPLAYFDAKALPTQDGKRLVFHCGSGVRSEKAAKAALSAGITPVAHLDGGFGAWKKAQKPHITTDMGTGAPKRVDGKTT